MSEFTNQAYVSYGNNQLAVSNIVAGRLVNPVSITLHAGDHSYRTGEIIPYVVTLRNRGAQTYTNMTVTDSMGAFFAAGEGNDNALVYPLKYVNESLQMYVNGERAIVPEMHGLTNLAISGLTIPPFGYVELMYQARVTNYAPVGGLENQITSTAVLSGEGMIDNPTARETIRFDPGALITVSKSVNPREVMKNQPMTYTFTIYNYGASEPNADNPVQLWDRFVPKMNIISVYEGHRKLTADTDYTYDSFGNFATKSKAITVPPAVYTLDKKMHTYSVMPGMTTITVTGTI